MDVVYVIGSGSKWDNNELRYSLRSLEQHFPHRNVVIVGVRPSWLQNIVHIDVQDTFSNVNGGKYKNVIQKIRGACKDSRVSEDFALMNDDFFFLRDTPEILPYSLGMLEDQIEHYNNPNSQYYNALIRTKRFLKKIGIESPASYAVHYPMMYNKSKFLQMIDELDWLEKPCSWRTIYGNMFNRMYVTTRDFKVSSEESLTSFLEKGYYDEFLSISDNVALLPKFQNWLKERFPNPSKYETN
jgi:hypothetical protein